MLSISYTYGDDCRQWCMTSQFSARQYLNTLDKVKGYNNTSAPFVTKNINNIVFINLKLTNRILNKKQIIIKCVKIVVFFKIDKLNDLFYNKNMSNNISKHSTY